MPILKRFARLLEDLRLLPESISRAVTLGPRYPSEEERRIVARMKSEAIRRELANRSAEEHEHEERQQRAYWQLWRSIQSVPGETIPPEILDQSVPDHISLALSVVGDYDAAREEPGAFSDCLYRPVSDLPYPQGAIRRCCEFLIGIADGNPASFNGDHSQLVNERDALGVALFSLDYFLDLPASQIPVAAPSERPLTCARSTPIVCMKAAMSSASISVEYGSAGLSVSPAPRGSTDMQVKCLA